MNVLPYVPFLGYRDRWIKQNLDKLKQIHHGQNMKDDLGEDMSYNVVEYYLCLAYDYTYFGSCMGLCGLRTNPLSLLQVLKQNQRQTNTL